MMRLLRKTWLVEAHWWAVVLFAAAVEWFAVRSHHAVEGIIEGQVSWATGGTLLVNFLVLFLAVQWLYIVRERWLGRLRTRDLHKEQPAELRPHLILFLSKLDVPAGDPRRGIPLGFEPSHDLEADLDRLLALKREPDPRRRVRWAWEMPLRAMRHHAAILDTVTIICSPESIQQVHWFCAAVRRYPLVGLAKPRVLLRRGSRIELAEDVTQPQSKESGWRFEEFDEIWDALYKLLRHMRHHEKREEKQIMVDFTGGKKVPSVAAAAITFNRGIKAQYVETEDCGGTGEDAHPVVSYDVEMETSYETGAEK